MNKKALIFNRLTVAIILLVLLVIFIFFLIKIRIAALKIVEDSECKTSIVTHTMLLRTTGEAVITDLYCPTKYYTIPGKDNEKTKQYVANALKTCWGMWGEGQLNLFSGENYYCHICSLIDFKDKSRKIEDISAYLINTPVESDKELTYAEYLGGYVSHKANPELVKRIKESGFPDTINTSNTYAVMFVYAKGEGFIKKLFDGLSEISGLSGTVGGGATAGLIVGIGAAILLRTGFKSAVVSTGAFTLAGAVIGFTAASDVNWVALTLFSKYDAETIKKIGCGVSPAKT